MLVQSGSGKVYAVLARNDSYELGVLPGFKQVSTTAFLILRLRFKSLQSDVFNPLMVPKPILVGGVERSGNTLRGNMMLNTGLPVTKIGKNFGVMCAEKLVEAAKDSILPDPGGSETNLALYAPDIRDDFVDEFGKLAQAQAGSVFPARDFSQAPALITPFDLQIWLDTTEGEEEAPYKAVVTDKGEDNVTKVAFGKHPANAGLGNEPDDTGNPSKHEYDPEPSA